MASAVAKRLLNVEEYYKMAEVGILKPSDRVELINGEIFDMSPIGSKHAAVVKKLARLLNEIFQNKAIIGIQDPIRLDSDNEPEPDISILQFRPDFYSKAHPGSRDIQAIIEVADSSIKHDKEVKAPLYASYGIPVYWIIDIENNCIEVLTNPKGSDYLANEIFQMGDSIVLLKKKLKVGDIIIQPKA